MDMWNKLGILVLVAMLSACGGNSTTKMHAGQVAEEEVVEQHTAANSLDYVGVYKGTLPAADCPGIEVTITLHADGTYTETNNYIERDTFTTIGKYTVEDNLLILDTEGFERPDYYKIEENRLRMLDAEKQPIKGMLEANYVLNKIN